MSNVNAEQSWWTLTQTAERLDPALGALALGRVRGALAAPAADLLVVRRLHDVGDVTARIHLESDEQARAGHVQQIIG